MKMIVPEPIDLLAGVASNVPEDDTYSAWNSGTAYAVDDVVYLATTHRRYICITAHTGINPTSDATNTYWSDLGATTRWRPFDGVLSRAASRPASLYYEVTPTADCDSIALFQISGSSVRIRVVSQGYDETVSFDPTPTISDFVDLFFFRPSFSNEALRTDLPLSAGDTVRIDVTATNGIAQIGEIILGNVTTLGTSTDGTSLGLESYSAVERDEFGTATVVPRPYSDKNDYRFAVTQGDEQRVKRLIGARLARPTVFLTDEAHGARGTIIYGFPTEFDLAVNTDPVTFCTLTVEGVI